MRKSSLVLVAAAALVAVAWAAASSGRSSVGPLDKHWLQSDTQGNIYEIAVGKLALEKGSGQDCNVARMLISDHSKALKENRSAAKQLHVALPNTPDPLQQALIQELSMANGSSFEQMFATIGVGDHKLDIKEAKETATEGQNPKIKSLARQDLPVLSKHLAAFTSLAKSVNSSLSTAGTTGGATATTGGTTTPAATTTSAGTTTPAATTGSTTTTSASPATTTTGSSSQASSSQSSSGRCS
jgi:predicted outer membrane protein